MYNNVENSKTYHFQQKSLKNTQYLGVDGHFSDLGKTGGGFCDKYIYLQPQGVSFKLGHMYGHFRAFC